MQIKKFKGHSLQEALDSVKKELGTDAVILETKKRGALLNPFSKSLFEVTVAYSQNKQKISRRSQNKDFKKDSLLTRNPKSDIIHKKIDLMEKSKESISAAKPKRFAFQKYIDIVDDFEADQQDKLSQQSNDQEIKTKNKSSSEKDLFSKVSYKNNQSYEELKHTVFQEMDDLKKVIAELKAHQEAHFDELQGARDINFIKLPVFGNSFEYLIMNGINRYYAFELIKKASFYFEPVSKNVDPKVDSEILLDFLANEIMEAIQVENCFKKNLTDQKSFQTDLMFLLGSTGSGKTTSIAKLASYALESSIKKIGLIHWGRFEKTKDFWDLSSYAKILNLPFRFVHNAIDFKVALNDFKGFDLIFVDNQWSTDKEYLDLLKSNIFLELNIGVKNYLLISALSREIEVNDTFNHFLGCGVTGLMVSKLDKAKVYGSIYNIPRKFGLPLNFFMIGQNVPEDIEVASRERLVSLIMNLK